MEPIIILSYVEHDVAKMLSLSFSKFEGFTTALTLDRMGKTPNFLIYNTRTKKCVTFRIHTSKFFSDSRADKSGRYRYNLVFKYIADLKRETADYHILHGQFPRDDLVAIRTTRTRSPKSWWRTIMLVYSTQEMSDLMAKIKQNANFRFGFCHPDSHVYLTSGLPVHEDVTSQSFGVIIPSIRSEMKNELGKTSRSVELRVANRYASLVNARLKT